MTHCHFLVAVSLSQHIRLKYGSSEWCAGVSWPSADTQKPGLPPVSVSQTIHPAGDVTGGLHQLAVGCVGDGEESALEVLPVAPRGQHLVPPLEPVCADVPRIAERRLVVLAIQLGAFGLIVGGRGRPIKATIHYAKRGKNMMFTLPAVAVR